MLQDNVPFHKTIAIREFLARKKLCFIQNPLYCPDLSPYDNYLFPELKMDTKRTVCDDVEAAVTRVIEAVREKSIREWFSVSRKYVQGTYFEQTF